MYCPDCGTDNSRNQKYCVRCGANLVVVDQARSIIQEVATGQPPDGINPSTVLKTAGVISVLGFLFTLIGAIVLTISSDRDGAPTGIAFTFISMTALILIVRRILRLIESPREGKPSLLASVLPQQTKTITKTQTRTLPEITDTPYYSVTEERTRPFERERER